LSLHEQAAIWAKIASIERQKLALAKQAKTASGKFDQEMFSVLSTRGTFFSQFAGNIFGQSSGGLTLGGTSGSSKSVNVEQNNHYNEIPKNRYYHARQMATATASAMEGI
jgi:hypothetical protein